MVTSVLEQACGAKSRAEECSQKVMTLDSRLENREDGRRNSDSSREMTYNLPATWHTVAVPATVTEPPRNTTGSPNSGSTCMLRPISAGVNSGRRNSNGMSQHTKVSQYGAQVLNG